LKLHKPHFDDDKNLRLPRIKEAHSENHSMHRDHRSTSRSTRSDQNSQNTKHKHPKIPKRSVDWFIRKKTAEILDEKWNLKEETIRTKNTRKNFDRTKTMNVVEKMKVYFRDNYTSSLDFFNGTKNANEADKRRRIEKAAATAAAASNQGLNDFSDLQMTHSLLEGSSSSRDFNHERESLYLKKLKNNFYDRKLWKSLSSFQEFNFLIDNHFRDYSLEFNILEPISLNKAETESLNSQTVRNTPNSTENQQLQLYNKQKFDNLRELICHKEKTDKVTRLQEIILTKSLNERELSLKKILEFIPFMKSLRIDKKYMLLCKLIENEGHELLEHLDEAVRKR
jgi:hypothetical protein